MLNICVVLGSVKEGRRSEAPAKYLVEKIQAMGNKASLADFKETPLPFYNAPGVPVMFKGKYPDSNVQKWSEMAKTADAFVIVAPEYNHSFPGVLKNALDWLYTEFERKPFALVGVSNGSVAGARVIEHLRPVIGNYNAMAIRETIMLGPIDNFFSETGEVKNSEVVDKKIEGLLKSLTWWAEALKKAR